MALTPGTRLGPYEFAAQIGVGGDGGGASRRWLDLIVGHYDRRTERKVAGLREAAAVFLLATSVMACCSGGPSGPSDGSDDTVVSDYASLVNALRAAGTAVRPAGAVSQPFFAPQGQVLSVDGEDVQVFAFSSPEAADTVTQSISADGSSIGTSMVGWVAPPHFYKAGRLIVIYVGSDSGVIGALQEVIGAQFAGT